MKDAAHTPGPWRLSPSGLTVVAGPDDPVGGWPNGKAVAATSRYTAPAVRLADARLIAAGPTGHSLLAALLTWWAKNGGRAGPPASAIYDEERTWGQAVEDYFRRVAGEGHDRA